MSNQYKAPTIIIPFLSNFTFMKLKKKLPQQQVDKQNISPNNKQIHHHKKEFKLIISQLLNESKSNNLK